ncbi:MAG: hypothetical protein ABIY70_08975 [Capsulimonas sp.]|uniref:hypothetical protein n=1 Tax=Capsulimonas sp. TaxID=2494211 RepID=UPI0032646600
METTQDCSVVTSWRFASVLATNREGKRSIWRSTRRDPTEPSVNVWFAVTEAGVRPSEDVPPGGWRRVRIKG